MQADYSFLISQSEVHALPWCVTESCQANIEAWPLLIALFLSILFSSICSPINANHKGVQNFETADETVSLGQTTCWYDKRRFRWTNYRIFYGKNQKIYFVLHWEIYLSNLVSQNENDGPFNEKYAFFVRHISGPNSESCGLGHMEI